MNLSTFNFTRSLNSDFSWLNPANRKELKKICKAHLADLHERLYFLNQEKLAINSNPIYALFQNNWALELVHEYIDETIKYYQSQVKRYGYYLTELNQKVRKATGQITEADIARGKEIPINTFYQGQLRKVGGRLLGLCPFHDEKTPSFTIWYAKNRWWCFGENRGGTVIDFIMLTRKCEFIDAVKFLIDNP